MKLDTEFYRLPLKLDAGRLAAEASQFGNGVWRPHPQGHPGNSALPLVAVGGDPSNDSVKGSMQPTPHLTQCPYIQQVLASLETVVGRTRLMRIEANAEATPHVDTNYYWMQRVRVHVPIITSPEVEFQCNDRKLHMPAGDAWVFNTWHRHNVINPTENDRIHLVIDTVGSTKFWDLIAEADRPFDQQQSFMTPRTVAYRDGFTATIETETVNYPIVMSPWEMQTMIGDLLSDMAESEACPDGMHTKLDTALSRFHRQWRSHWASHGESESGWDGYHSLLTNLDQSISPFENQASLGNGIDVVEVVRQAIVRAALNTDLAGDRPPVVTSAAAPQTTESTASGFDRPVFMVAAPRSGSTLLFETLAQSPTLWTVGGESHQIIEQFSELRPEAHEWESNRLTAADATEETTARLHEAFRSPLRNRDDQPLPESARAWRFLEKTPKNCLRIPFLKSMFPDARFIYLYREPQSNISSIMEAWRSERFVTYPDLPDWEPLKWSLVLVPGWRDLIKHALSEVATEQWIRANEVILDDLHTLESTEWCTVSYQEFLDDPQATIQRLCRFAGVEWDRDLASDALPHSRYTLTPPDPNKWKKNLPAMTPYLRRTDAIADRARAAIDTDWTRKTAPSPEPVPVAVPAPQHAPALMPTQTSKARPTPPPDDNDDSSPLRSVHTTSLPQLLNQLGVSVLISTYQAGRVVVARSDGDTLNTHFCGLSSPMGMAVRDGQLAIGTKHQIWLMRNMKSVAKKLSSQHDACYLPQSSHVTGDIRIHEIAWSDNELWIVNTRFSCLCTLDSQHSFVPRWKPPFITQLLPEDRCHLNGLALVDGRPKYVTALGTSDAPAGWRDNKAFGGCLMDITNGDVISGGLSMPHSPRWHDGRLWVLESGAGTLATVDPESGQLETVAEVPGFTRGLDFYGPLAFIGLSQVRESAVFSGIPITERVPERSCGMWIVDTRNGKTVAFLRFDDAVQEVFAVQVVPHRFPELRSERENEGNVISNSFHVP